MLMRVRLIAKFVHVKMHIGCVHTYIMNYVMLRYYTLYLQSFSVCYYFCRFDFRAFF